jgi:hypothetical protein
MLGDRAWLRQLLDELSGLIGPVFAQARSWFAAFAYVAALLAVAGDRKSCWQLGEAAGHATPRRMQALLAEYARDWRAVLARPQRFILAHLGDPDAILVLDETAELKKGTMTVGVARQHADITGQVENCQTVVFLAYVTARAHTLFDFRLYLPKQWCEDGCGVGGRRFPKTWRSRPRPSRAPAWSLRRLRKGAVQLRRRRRGLRPQLKAPGRLRGRRERLRLRDPGQLHGHHRRRPHGDRRRPGPAGPRPVLGDPLVRAGLQGPPRLRVGDGGDQLAASPCAEPPQHLRPR